MQTAADHPEAPTAIRHDLGAIFISLELSRSTWLITSLSPGGGEKMSKHSVRGGNSPDCWSASLDSGEGSGRTGRTFPIIVIQEAGLDGFSIDRVLQNEGIESHVVDPASVATSRRRRRAKTDRIDGEALLRTLLAYKRANLGCARWSKRHPRRRGPPPSLPRAQSIDQRTGPARQPDQRAALRARRIRLRAAAPQSAATAQRVEDGRWPSLAKASQDPDQPGARSARTAPQQIKAVETERDALLAAQKVALPGPAAMLLDFNGIGPGFTAVLWSEGLFRHFDNRHQVLLCRAGANTLAKWIRRSRAGIFESRQSSIADDAHSTRLAMAAPSAAIRAGFVV